MRRIVLLSSVILLAACGNPQQEEFSGSESVADTIPQQMLLVPVDSIGIEMGDSTYMLGSIFNTLRDQDDNIVMLDRQDASVRIFSPGGEALQVFPIQGEGPGQFTLPDRLCCLQDGGYFLSSFFDRKICRFDSEMNLMCELLNTSSNMNGPTRIYALDDSTFVGLWMFYTADFDSAGSRITVHSNSIEVPDALIWEKKVELIPGDYSWQVETAVVLTVTPDRDILVYNFSTEDWLISRFDREGNLQDTLERPYEPVRKSDEQIASETEATRQNWIRATGSEAGFNFEPNEYLSSIKTIQVDDQNRLWVERGSWEEVIFDVMTMDGEDLFTCTFDAPQWQKVDRWSVRVNNGDFLATPRNPELYPLVYMLELVPLDTDNEASDY